MRDAIAVQLLGAVDKKSAKLAIKNALAPYKQNAAIANALFVPAVLADLAGQLMVHAYEAPHGKERVQLALGEGQDTSAFLAMGWEEALAYFEARGLVREKDLDRLLKRHAKESEKARDLMLKRVQERVYELLGDAIGEGSTYRDFAVALRSDAEGLGITAGDSSYLDLVYRTNVMDAYGAGRQRAMQHPAVVAARPFRQIRTAGDGRVREEHAQADGMVFTADGPLAQLRPPFGYRCRCSVTTLSTWEGDVVESVPSDLLTPGFGGL